MTDDIIDRAKAAQRAGPSVGSDAYRNFVHAVRRRIGDDWDRIVEANNRDLTRARERGLPAAKLDRLRLSDDERAALEQACDSIHADLPRSAGTSEEWHGPKGVRARRILRPLGVVLMIFEARAEITLRSATMCAATGNAVLLRGGAEIAETNIEIGRLLDAALADAGLPAGLVTVLDSADRSLLRKLLRRDDAIDVLIPRGGPSLIELCRTASRIPLIASGGGVNHLYVHHTADSRTAAALAVDGKLADPAACTALEMVLVDDKATDGFLDALVETPNADGLTLRLPEQAVDRVPAALADKVDATPLGEHDNGREFMDPTLAVRFVTDVDEAIDHIDTFGSGHTESVAAEDDRVVTEFCQRVDATAIVVNGSPHLNNGPAMGAGAFLAISTGRLHARGPVTLPALFTHTWIIEGADH